jgi:mono/diheme cytochrome c family protein
MFKRHPALGAAALFCWMAGCADDSYPTPPAEVLGSEAAVKAGEVLYQKNCSLCHGPSGEGDGPQARSLDPPPADLRNLGGARADRGYWFLRIQRGGKDGPLPRERSAMPGWGEHLSDEQIWQLVSYLDAMVEGRR